jgi:hypothetical protein
MAKKLIVVEPEVITEVTTEENEQDFSISQTGY